MTIGVLSEPAEYLKVVARPIFERFQAEPTAVELAVSTCIVIAHFADVLGKHSGQKDLARVRRGLVALSPSFRVIDAFCNAAKHVEIDKPDRPGTAHRGGAKGSGGCVFRWHLLLRRFEFR